MRIGMGMGLHDLILRVRAGLAQSTLLQSLISYWPLNEVSGVRYDAVGSNHLTDNNTVGAKLRGPEGTVANFSVANTESLSVTAPAPGSYTIAAWGKSDLAPTEYGPLVSLKNGVLGILAFAGSGVPYPGQNYAALHLYDGVGWTSTGGWGGTVADGGWAFLVGTCDASTKEAKVFANLEQRATTTVFPGVAGDFSTDNIVTIGNKGQYSQIGPTANFSPQIGPVGLWSRVLTSDERTALFAAGNGLRYADLPAGLLTGLVSWWELDEVSGVRYDSHGSNDLTDNNTVGGVNSGPKGVVADFVYANNEKLNRAYPASLDLPTAYTYNVWFKAPTVQPGAYLGVMGWGEVFSQCNISVNGNVIYTRVMDNTGDWTATGTGIAIHDNQWHMVTVWWNSSDKKQYVRLDGNPSLTWSSSALTSGTLKAQTGIEFAIGNWPGGGGAGYCPLSNAAVWGTVLGESDIIALFALGRGLKYDSLPAGLLTGLVSYWNLDEGSGVRYDSHGSNDLTDNNTVGSVINAGDAMDGAAASFVAANAEYFSGIGRITSPVTTVSMWVRPATFPDYAPLFLSSGAASNYTVADILIQQRSDGQVDFYVADTNVNIQTPAAQALTAGEWTNLIFELDTEGKNARIWFDNGSAHEVVGYTGVAPTPDRWFIGRTTTGNAFDGSIDEVAIWDRVLTADERAELYNLGRGKFYAFE